MDYMEFWGIIFIFFCISGASNVDMVAKCFTIEEIYSQFDTLNGKTIATNGTVVKVMQSKIIVEGIKGDQWFHIQDGTGNSAMGTNDLTIVYYGDPLLYRDDKVVVTGTLVKRDIGMSYSNLLFVENATVSLID